MGDSTTAPIQPWEGSTPPGGGGWGDGFLATLNPGAGGINLGKNGQTTVSYRENGWWKQVVDKIGEKVVTNDVSFLSIFVWEGRRSGRWDGLVVFGYVLMLILMGRFGVLFSLDIMIRNRRRVLVLRSMRQIWRRW